MNSRRLLKHAQAIKETISMQVLYQLKDPRIQNVTVLAVDVAPDLRTANVYVSVMGTEAQQQLALHGLRSSRGFLQKKIADRIQTKNTPVLNFKLDDSVKKSVATAQLLRTVLPEGESSEDTSGEEGDLSPAVEGVPADGEATDSHSESVPQQDDDLESSRAEE